MLYRGGEWGGGGGVVEALLTFPSTAAVYCPRIRKMAKVSKALIGVISGFATQTRLRGHFGSN